MDDASQVCYPKSTSTCKAFAWYKLDPYTCEGGHYCEFYGAGAVSTTDDLGSGITSYNDLPHVWLLLFQITTLEGWSDQVARIQDTYSPLAWIYFLLVVIIGAFALM